MAEPRYRMPDEAERDADLSSGKMGFLEHLDELRTRLIYSCVAVAAGTVVSFFFVDRIADFVLAAAVGTLPADAGLITTSDPWNQAIFAAPMLALYVISIGLAWLVAPGRQVARDDRARGLKLVFAAAVIDHASRRRHAPAEFPRRVAGRRGPS